MGFRDYYRQFDDIDEAELNLERRERRRQEKAAALERAPDIDLSGTEWPDLPHSEIVNAAIARARGFVQRYPDRHATAVRRLLADRHGLSPDQIALGNGAAELLQSAALALLSAGDELVTPWPSYPLYPLMAAHAGATPVPVERRVAAGAVTDRTQAVVICNPNDPTGSYLSSAELARRSSPPSPSDVHVLLDEALVHFQDAEDLDACLRLVERLPAPPGGAHLLEDLRPVRPASGLRGDLGLAPARRGRAGARHQRADPGRRGVRAANAATREIDRRRAGRGPRAQRPDRASCASWAWT